jgi:hypothetical protein
MSHQYILSGGFTMTNQTFVTNTITEANECPTLSTFDLLTDYNKMDMLSDAFANACFEVYPSGLRYQLLSDEDKKRVQVLYVEDLKYHNVVITSDIINYIEKSGHFSVIIPILKKYMADNAPATNSMFNETVSNVKANNKVTIIMYSDFGFPYAINTIIDSFEIKQYAQHKDSLFITHKPKGKRKLWEEVIKPYQSFIIYDGWLNVDIDSITKSVIRSDSSMTVIQGNYKCFDKRYLTDIASAIPQKPLISFNVKEAVTC